MMGNKIIHVYKCPHCKHENVRSYKVIVQMRCDGCSKYFPAEQNWYSSSCHFNQDDRTYFVGGIRFTKDMSFDVKTEQVAQKFKPKFIEHGKGYAVFEYDLAHSASCAANFIRANLIFRESWELSTNGARLAILDKKWKAEETKKEEDDNDNSTYAG